MENSGETTKNDIRNIIEFQKVVNLKTNIQIRY